MKLIILSLIAITGLNFSLANAISIEPYAKSCGLQGSLAERIKDCGSKVPSSQTQKPQIQSYTLVSYDSEKNILIIGRNLAGKVVDLLMYGGNSNLQGEQNYSYYDAERACYFLSRGESEFMNDYQWELPSRKALSRAHFNVFEFVSSMGIENTWTSSDSGGISKYFNGYFYTLNAIDGNRFHRTNRWYEASGLACRAIVAD